MLCFVYIKFVILICVYIVTRFENLGSTQNSSNSFKPWKTRLSINDQPWQNLVSALMASGAHLGHQHSQWNPSMRPFIYGTRNGQSIIDLEQTVVAIKRASMIVKGIVENDGLVLFVGNKNSSPTLTKSVERSAKNLESNGYCIPSNWLPGTLTNRYRLLPGGKPLQPPPLPDLVIFASPMTYPHALRECALLRIPTIGLIDTDCDPRGVTYSIPANDDSERTAELILNLLAESGKQGLISRKELDESKSKSQRRIK